MSMNQHPSLVFGLALLLAAFGVAAHAQSPNSASNVQATAAPKTANNYRIGPGDVLLIEVAGEPNLNRKANVSKQGTIRLPYINHDLQLGGRSELQAAELLNKEFLAILKDPQVTVFIEEYNAQFVGVAGAVKNPKRFPLTRELR